jgi:hypothetical protein
MLTKAQIEFLKKHLIGAVLHWTAGNYTQTSSHYHFCITYDKTTGKAKVIQVRSVYERGEHIWHRNTGLVGFSICAEYSAAYPTQKVQKEALAKAVAEFCFIFDIDPDEQYQAKDLNTPGVWYNIDRVADHATYAKIDKYGKVDITKYYDEVKGKIRWYLSKLKSGEHKIEYLTNIR